MKEKSKSFQPTTDTANIGSDSLDPGNKLRSIQWCSDHWTMQGSKKWKTGENFRSTHHGIDYIAKSCLAKLNGIEIQRNGAHLANAAPGGPHMGVDVNYIGCTLSLLTPKQGSLLLLGFLV
jgi:hypothetical protein